MPAKKKAEEEVKVEEEEAEGSKSVPIKGQQNKPFQR